MVMHGQIYLSAVDSVAACLAQPVEALQCDYAYSYFWMTQVFLYFTFNHVRIRVRVRDRVGVRFISNVNYSVFSFPEGQMYDMI